MRIQCHIMRILYESIRIIEIVLNFLVMAVLLWCDELWMSLKIYVYIYILLVWLWCNSIVINSNICIH